MTEDQVALHGAMTLFLHKANGEIETIHKDNLIVDAGFDFIADAIGRPSARPSHMSHVGLGTGTTASASAQKSLVKEIDRNAATYAHTVGTKAFTFTASFPPGDATGPITEAGVFNAANGGVMLDRVVFPVVNKGPNDSLTTVFTFTMSQ